MKLLIILLPTAVAAFAGVPEGRAIYERSCASCHGGDGRGGVRAPSITAWPRTVENMKEIITAGLPARGMPAFRLEPAELNDVIAFIQSLAQAERVSRGLTTPPLFFTDIAAPKPGEWPTYHGRLDGNRHSPLTAITPANVSRLAPRWIFPIGSSNRLEVTPVVVGGVMYVTSVNEAYALDARTGRRHWMFSRRRTPGLAGDAASGINRGAAVYGDRLFIITDNAHLLALDRSNGRIIWDVEMADSQQNYGATSAPLIVNDLVVSGVSGGDEGIRGFLAAYRPTTGERVWRLWTIPDRTEPAASTWQGSALEHGCGATWLTGTYDPSSRLLYWATGNPCPDHNGDERRGDNLYTDSVLAIEAATGKLRWHYQFTPHDLHDWDAQQTPMLLDTRFQGRDRKLLVQANRNGFFYVLDRITGELLLAKPFVEKLTWASAVGADGRPVLVPGNDPTPEGTRACPSVEGATNWMSVSFNPATRLFYVMALEKCSIYTKRPETWRAGQSFYGGGVRSAEPGRKHLRALDLDTGRTVWDYPMEGPGTSWGGVLSTASGLVFAGDDSGDFTAVDAKTGKPVWRFTANQYWKASPMTYTAGGEQFVAVAAGGNIISFALVK